MANRTDVKICLPVIPTLALLYNYDWHIRWNIIIIVSISQACSLLRQLTQSSKNPVKDFRNNIFLLPKKKNIILPVSHGVLTQPLQEANPVSGDEGYCLFSALHAPIKLILYRELTRQFFEYAQKLRK